MINSIFFGQNGILGNTPVLNLSPSTINNTTGNSSLHIIYVTTNTTWIANTPNSWITFSSGDSGTGDGTTNVTLSNNTTGSVRNGSITYTGTIGGNNVNESVSVTQSPITVTIFAEFDPVEFDPTLYNISCNYILYNSSNNVVDSGSMFLYGLDGFTNNVTLNILNFGDYYIIYNISGTYNGLSVNVTNLWSFNNSDFTNDTTTNNFTPTQNIYLKGNEN